MTPPVFDLEAFDAFRRRTAHVPVPIVAAVRPFDSLLHAEYLANEVPNIRVPEALLERMRRADGGRTRAVAEGVAIAQEIARELRTRAQGLQIGGPMPSVLRGARRRCEAPRSSDRSRGVRRKSRHDRQWSRLVPAGHEGYSP